MNFLQDIIGTVANTRIQEHHRSGWITYLISQTGEKEVSETSQSEELNDNVSANEMDDIQRPCTF